MAVADKIPAPELVEFDAKGTSGLDLLGLRLPVQTIGNTLLNGITTITPTVRYLSFRTWLLYRYVSAEPRPEDRAAAFVNYARHAEAAFVLGNLLRDRSTVGLVGPRKGGRKLEEEGDILVIEPLVADQPAVDAYGRPSDQLRLTQSRGSHVPALGREHGEPLALAMEEALEGTSIADRLRTPEPLESASREELEEFGQVAWVDEIPQPERLELIRTLMSEDPAPDDRARLATYAILLSLADHLGAAITEHHLFQEAVRPERALPDALHQTLDGWLLYAVRDAVAVAGEASLAAVARKLAALDPDRAGIQDVRLVVRLIEDSMGEQLSALREIGLGDGTEDLALLPYRELVARLEEATPEEVFDRGIRRWSGALTEPTIHRAVGGVRDGALILGILAWMLADRRVGDAVRSGDGVRAGESRLGFLSHQGTSRFGMTQVILPRLDQWYDRDLSVAAVLSEFTHLVIDQHLRIAWSRLAQDPTKDVAVFHRDSDRLILHRTDYEGGRTASRLEQAISWLRQLDLLGDGGISREGRMVLDLAIKTLS